MPNVANAMSSAVIGSTHRFLSGSLTVSESFGSDSTVGLTPEPLPSTMAECRTRLTQGIDAGPMSKLQDLFGKPSIIFATASRIFAALASGPPTTAWPMPRKTNFLVRASTKSRIIVPS